MRTSERRTLHLRFRGTELGRDLVAERPQRHRGLHLPVLSRADVRILHLIRDPRDVLISALHYHRTAREAWLRQPAPSDDNVAYQHKLNSLGSVLEQYLFELENSAGDTIDDMLDWQYGRANCLEVRYEDLWVDHSMALWSRIASFLGFEDAELVEVAARADALFLTERAPHCNTPF